MAISAFVIRNEDEGAEFAESFLKSSDFDHKTLQQICHDFDLLQSGDKATLASRISTAVVGSRRLRQRVILGLIMRPQKWVSIQIGDVQKTPRCEDPVELVTEMGQPSWYGPISLGNEVWYMRSVFVPHMEAVRTVSDDLTPTTNVVERQIRWLCFARISSGVISIHWQGFSHIDNEVQIGRNRSQFDYWNYVPGLFEELEELTSSGFEPIDLYRLILHTLWDRYRLDQDNYVWEDRRIRAQAGGVNLNARSVGAISGTVDLDVKGIIRLAQTIRRAVEFQLKEAHEIEMPEPREMDEIILRTLIRDFGALSYEFTISNKVDGELFRGHAYFGALAQSNSCSDPQKLDTKMPNLRG